MQLLLSVLVSALIVSSYAQTNPCIGIPDGQFVDDPASCPAYYQCIGEVATPGICPEPYQFYPEEQHCSYAIGECANYWLQTTTSTTMAPLTGYECIANDIHYLPHTHSCTKYVLCYNGVAKVQECAADLEFHPTELNCVAAGSSECFENPCPEEDAEEPEFFPNYKDCNSYYICLNAEPKEFSCYPEYVFDMSSNKCNLRENVDTAHCDGSAVTSSP